MYARTVKRRLADGDTATYVQLAVTERRDGIPRARVVHNFGREDELDRHAIRRLVRSLLRFLPPMAPVSQERMRAVELSEGEQNALMEVAQAALFERGWEESSRWEEDPELASLASAVRKIEAVYYSD